MVRLISLTILFSPACLSVTLVYCGQTVGWIKMKLGAEVGLNPGNTVFNGNPAPQKRGTAALHHFSAHVYCGKTAEWIKMPLGTERGLDPGHIVRWGPTCLPLQRGTAAPHFSADVCCVQMARWIKMPLCTEAG